MWYKWRHIFIILNYLRKQLFNHISAPLQYAVIIHLSRVKLHFRWKLIVICSFHNISLCLIHQRQASHAVKVRLTVVDLVLDSFVVEPHRLSLEPQRLFYD